MKSRIIKTEEEIQEALISLSSKLNEVYFDKDVELVKMNHAANLFLDDLSKLLTFNINVHSLEFKTYNKSAKLEVEITKDLYEPINSKHVILIDGIIISGNTHDHLSKVLSKRKPKSLSIVCIGVKEESKKISLPTTYSMFNFRQEWVEGYGIGSLENSINKHLVDVKINT